MSQEDSNIQVIDGGEGQEQAQGADASAAQSQGLPPAVIQELQQLRAAVTQRDEETHALRMAALRSVAAGPQVDPVDAAMKKLQANTDPDAWKFIAPAMRPVLEEMAQMRQQLSQADQNLAFLASQNREMAVHSQLSQLVPDLATLGPKLMELVRNLPPNVQRQYAENPALFVPLAQAVREQTQAGAKRSQGARAAVSMDAGGGSPGSTPTTADAILAMDPNSKEFGALRRSFFGSDV